MRFIQRILEAAGVCLLIAATYAQVPNLEPKFGLDRPVATITFDVAFPSVLAEHYVFSVDSTGSAAYHSDDIGRVGRIQSALGNPYVFQFTISEATCAHIFDLARQANYFKGKFSTINEPLVNASVTTLTYREGPPFSFDDLITNVVHNVTTYSYTANPALQELAQIFQSIAGSIELGRRLDYLHHSDQSALAAALTAAVAISCNHQFLELNIIQPTLRDVADDPSIAPDSRERARQLLWMAQAPPPPVSRLSWCQTHAEPAAER